MSPGRARAGAAKHVGWNPLRRDRVEIWRDILQAVRSDARRAGATPPSRIQAKVNLPYDRFWRHVMDLEARGLLVASPLGTTRAGDRFLARTEALRDELQRLRGDE